MDLYTAFRKAAALIAATACTVSAHAQDGAYDPSFGDVSIPGRTWIDVSPSPLDDATKLIQLPGGNLFMAGSCGPYPCAAWLTPSGNKISGYGNYNTHLGTSVFVYYVGWPGDAYWAPGDVAAFADGRVVVPVPRGSASGASYIAVTSADGKVLDPAVGNGAGYVLTTLPSPVFVRVTPQQQVIAVGTSATSPASIVVSRYDSTLHLDTSFGTGGSTAIGIPDGDFVPHGMTLQRDGKIVVIGQYGAGAPYAVGIVRLTAGGSPDPNFGISSDGRFESDLDHFAGVVGNAIAEDKKGRLVLAGYAVIDGTHMMWLVHRLTSGGAQDAAFNGGHARIFVPFDSSQLEAPQAFGVALQGDGRIVVAGTMDREPINEQKYFAIARFTDAGAFDATFGIGGLAYGDMSTQQPNVLTDFPAAMVISGGGIIIGGSTVTGTNEHRFTAMKARIDPLFADGFD